MTEPAATRAERLAAADQPNFPEEYGAPLKESIVPSEDEAAVTAAWSDLITELGKLSKEIAERGPEIIPQVEFKDLDNLTAEQKEHIRQIGSVVIKNVVDDEIALKWKQGLKEYVEANPQIDGFPEGDKQFFMSYWSKPQTQARSHPNMLKTESFLNALWSKPRSPDTLISFSSPVVYADRFRIRTAKKWDRHPPHIDGATIERWSEDNLRSCYAEILKGDWRAHDAYTIDGRVAADQNIHKRPGQASVFRSWQGWLAMSNTGPGEGTLKVFPNVKASNAYVVLRPFFRLKSSEADPLKPESWVFDNKTAHFPGLQPGKSMRLNEDTHPHLRLDTTMTCMPRVQPGDTVWWHCDVIHSVEEIHNGPSDSSVMYIPAAPLTLRNASYLPRQRETFLRGAVPPDFGTRGETDCKGRGEESDIISVEGRRAMGFEPFPITEDMAPGEKELLKQAALLIAA